MGYAEELPKNNKVIVTATKSTDDIVNEAYNRLGGKYSREQIRQCFLTYLRICQITMEAGRICNIFSIFKTVANARLLVKFGIVKKKVDG